MDVGVTFLEKDAKKKTLNVLLTASRPLYERFGFPLKKLLQFPF
ncbi:hypothetical protein HMPREF9141_1577 [Prevotella multiformis DSM 16608]|uniref:Uncharacterized protein n=1 Tax=Prevotella multiformis DSM 16608 TaxID=888743 RepID=F0F7L0_9BACT|nr:hypothetical protein HMPREF9141_1577 [Prevotella multiformis DSM 16608]